MARFPIVGGDTDGWAAVLNEFLGIAHNPDGTLKAILNVKDSVWAGGAKGDGVTDDQPAWQAAIDAATLIGAAVYGPPAQYALGSSIQLKNHVSLIGGGSARNSPEYSVDSYPRGTEFVHKASGARDFHLIKNADAVNGNSGILIRGIRCNMGIANADVSGINFSKVRRSLIDDVYLVASNTLTAQPTSRRGITVDGSSEMNWIQHCFLHNLGLYVANANAIYMNDLELAMGGIQAVNGFDNRVVGCQIYSDNVAIGTDYAAWRSGIVFQSVTDGLISKNHVVAFRQDGIVLLDSNHCKVISNHSCNNSRLTAGTWGGLLLDSFGATCKDNLIANNSFYDRGVPTQTQQWGIRLAQSAGVVDKNLIVGNDLDNNLGGPVNVIGTPGAGNIFRDNKPFAVPSTASAAALTLPVYSDVHLITGTTNITSIAASWPGRRVTLIFAGALTLTDGSNLKLGSNFVTTADDAITLVCDGTNWYEAGARSVN